MAIIDSKLYGVWGRARLHRSLFPTGVARQILAVNTEKAHNLKERALEVFRIYRGLVDEQPREPESNFAFYLEHPSLVTLGIIYEQRKMFAGGAYHLVLRRLEEFSMNRFAPP